MTSNANTLPVTWHKSTRSSDNGGDCVEVGTGIPAMTPVRDSKDPAGPALLFPAHAWQAFVTATTADSLDAV
ncbi:DUF397 domain-containing protein [Kitasatospora sp. NBC_00240]|uniref:DUF397 domain-containing protein n=1 Tax=Kitasatospora sp. NBC_00240 TaxID=2903567 RepID=UPI00225AB828|nr:DUF397 domain-containing protein [Kitasatospora sp. NBC_00240]MCX5212888.1 DUF397 domain-containing protein [Kitasatospora sp. NBC_00240]